MTDRDIKPDNIRIASDTAADHDDRLDAIKAIAARRAEISGESVFPDPAGALLAAVARTAAECIQSAPHRVWPELHLGEASARDLTVVTAALGFVESCLLQAAACAGKGPA